jgi:hypothetical protein
MTSSAFVTPRGLGARFEIDARFVQTDPGFVSVLDGATQQGHLVHGHCHRDQL